MQEKGFVLVFLLLSVAARSSHALSAQAVVEAQKGDFRQSSVFSSGAGPLSPDRVESVILLKESASLEDAALFGSLRLDNRHLFGPDSFYRRSNDVRINELFVEGGGQGWTATLGKKIVRWGVAYAWSPTDLVSTLRNALDPSDRLLGNQGTWIAQADNRDEHSQLDIVYAADMKNFQVHEQVDDSLMVRYYRFLDRFDFSVMAKEERGWYALGANMAVVAGKAWEFHAEYAYRNDREKITPLAAVSGTVTPFSVGHDFEHEFVMGGHYTTESAWNIAVEYLHNGAGLDAGEWKRLKQLADLLSPSNRGAGISSLLNLSGLNSLTGANFALLRREYLFARLYLPELIGLVSLEIYSLVGLEDGSGTNVVELRSHRSGNYEIYLRYMDFRGAERTEFGYVPLHGAIMIGLNYYFGK